MALTAFITAQTLVTSYCRNRKHLKPLWFNSVSNNILWFTFVKVRIVSACFGEGICAMVLYYTICPFWLLKHAVLSQLLDVQDRRVLKRLTNVGLLACSWQHLWKDHYLQDHPQGKQPADEEWVGRLVDALRVLLGPPCIPRIWSAQGRFKKCSLTVTSASCLCPSVLPIHGCKCRVPCCQSGPCYCDTLHHHEAMATSSVVTTGKSLCIRFCKAAMAHLQSASLSCAICLFCSAVSRT